MVTMYVQWGWLYMYSGDGDKGVIMVAINKLMDELDELDEWIVQLG